MKKLLLVLSVFMMSSLLSAQVNYYVAENGSDENDGLSESNPLLTLRKARDLIAVDFDAATDFIINLSGVVTDQVGASTFTFNNTSDVTVTVKGESAATTILQKMDDAKWDSIASVMGSSPGRFFQNPENKGGGTVTLIIEDMTIKNFGHTVTNGGLLINGLKNSTIVMRRCNILNGIARGGSLIQTQGGGSTICDFTMEDCYVSNMKTFDNNTFASPITINGASSGTFKNCVFNNCTRDPRPNGNSETSRFSHFGSVITFNPAADKTITGVIVNCTFVDNGFAPIKPADSLYYAKVSELCDSVQQAPVSAFLDSTETLEITFANNLLIANGEDDQNFVDFKLLKHDYANLTQNSFDNNVMNAISAFEITTNDTSASYTYESSEIVIEAIADSLIIATAENGMMYVKAGGTSVFQKGTYQFATVTDITGAYRDASNPCVGAYEASELMTPPLSLSSVDINNFKLYPNPADEQVYFKGVSGVFNVSFYNLAGQVVKSQTAVQSSIDVSDLSAGLYYVKATGDEVQALQMLMVK